MKKDVRFLQKVLGLNRFSEGAAYRQCYLARPHGAKFRRCCRLATSGLLRRDLTTLAGNVLFQVTEEGYNYVKRNGLKRTFLPNA